MTIRHKCLGAALVALAVLGTVRADEVLAPSGLHAESVVATAVDAILKRYAQAGLPGCAAGIVIRGNLAVFRSYGLADVENGVPIAPETRFDIGSMSKQFLALAVLRLSAEGKLALDADVHTYLPELPKYSWKATLRQMLHHTSGLKDYDQLLQIAGWRDGDLKSSEDILWIIRRQKQLAFRPGTQHSYSDSNYFLLGYIVQRIAGKPLAQYLGQTIFQPLGMAHTSLRTDRWSLIPHKASPYSVEQGKARLFVDAQEPLGDGGIFSTVGDLALWERNFDDAKVGGKRVIAEMQRVEQLADGTANDYAAGLYLRIYRGIAAIEHSGASYGYLAEKIRFPGKRLSLIVLCNRRDAPYVEMANRLADLSLGLAPEASAISSLSPSPKAALERFAGTYFSDETADGVILEARDGAIYDQGADREYRQIGPVTFQSAPAGLCRCSTTYTFGLGPDGAVEGFRASRPPGSRMGKTIETFYARMTAAKSSTRLYAGEYVSEDVASAWCVLKKGDTLFVRRRGFADRPLQIVWENAAAGPGGILQFIRRAGAVTGFKLRNTRVNSVEFTRLAGDQHPVPQPWSCG